jgi:hypothetical protein
MGAAQSPTLLLRYKTSEARCEAVDSLEDLTTAALLRFQNHFVGLQTHLKFVYEPLLFPIDSDADLRVVYRVAVKNSLRELPIVVSKRLSLSGSPMQTPALQPQFPLAKIKERGTGMLLGGGLLLPSLRLCCTSRAIVSSSADLSRIHVKVRKAVLFVTQEQFLLSSSLNLVCFSYQAQGQAAELTLEVSLQCVSHLAEGEFCTAVQPAGNRYVRMETVAWSAETATVSGPGLALGSLAYDLNWRLLGLVTGPRTIVLAPALYKLVHRTEI